MARISSAARHYTVYLTNQTLQFPDWDTSTNRPTLPIEVTQFDDGGTPTERYRVDPARTAQTSGVPTGLSSGTDQSHYLRWSRQVYETTDPAGRESQRTFDDAGRVTKTIDNYTDGNPATGSSDEDVTVEMAYNSDGKLTTLTAKNPTTSETQ